MKSLVVLFALCGASCVAGKIGFDIDLETLPSRDGEFEHSPAQLDMWQREFEEGRTWRGNPWQVAHEAIQAHFDVPWKGEAFNPSKYELIESNAAHPEWGSYVVRGYTDRSGRLIRYRVKISRHKGIWYCRQVSHYIMGDTPDPFFETGGPPHVR